MSRTKLGALAALALIAVPAAHASAFTLGPPDARDANAAAQQRIADAAVPRSPDAADLDRYARLHESRPVVVTVPSAPAAARKAGDSFDLGDAGIGAGAAVVLAGLALAAAGARRHVPQPS